MAKLGFEVKIAKQKGKGSPRDGEGKDVGTLPTKATRSPYDNPAKGKEGRGTEQIKGKLGS